MDLLKYHINITDSPIWAFAIHDGHQIDEQLLPYMLLTSAERLREEDPYTALFAELPVNQFIVGTSRFQLDLNRKIEDAVYLRPEQAWGLKVWSPNLPQSWKEKLYRTHHDIYFLIDRHIERTIHKYGYFILLDIHSYNAKRTGPTEVIDTEKNPQINMGTFYNSSKWKQHITEYVEYLSTQKIMDQPIDIRENIKFKGGYLSQYINNKYADKGYVLSIEFRKDFMNEWTGEANAHLISMYKQLLINSLAILNNHAKN